jgi:transcription antitermination factor NusG
MSSETESPPDSWYAVYTRAQYEPAVATALREVVEVSKVLLPVFHRLKPHLGEGTRVVGLHEVMFPNYVLFSSLLTPEVSRAIMRVEGVGYILGTTPRTPSPIPEEEIALVRHLADAERDPRLGEAPVKGRIARVMAGPLSGVEGLVLWRNNHEARLATRLRLAAGCFEIRLPLDILMLSNECRWSDGTEVRPSHRGGRRGRGSRPLAA